MSPLLRIPESPGSDPAGPYSDRKAHDRPEETTERHAPDQPVVILHLTDDLFPRSFQWARWQLGMPLPVD
jgi:hypothetical protein